MTPRRVIYPYRLCDKLALFPYKHYWENSWQFKYSIIGFILATPFFYKMQKLTCSPANVERFKILRAKEEERVREHMKHLY